MTLSWFLNKVSSSSSIFSPKILIKSRYSYRTISNSAVSFSPGFVFWFLIRSRAGFKKHLLFSWPSTDSVMMMLRFSTSRWVSLLFFFAAFYRQINGNSYTLGRACKIHNASTSLSRKSKPLAMSSISFWIVKTVNIEQVTVVLFYNPELSTVEIISSLRLSS
jgi:hypothetical protein